MSAATVPASTAIPAAPPRTAAAPATLPARLLRARPLVAVASVLAVVALWELYKWLGPEQGWALGEDRVLPRTTDLAMPHTWQVLTRLTAPVSGATGADVLWLAVLRAAAASFGVALVGWTIGVLVGAVLAVAMQRVRVVEAAVLPLVVLSQTVPLIALAPLVRSWGGQLELGAFAWQPWMSVAVIASYLAFFPVAVGMLRGLQSPDAIHVELLRSYGAGWGSTLLRLRLPAAVPYLLPALRLAAANAVVGTVVAEVATGLPGGLGRTILEFANFAASDPPKPWAPILGAVLLGLVAAGLVALLGRALRRYRRVEVAS
ncbi:ABC transporter permease [Cellulomonas wangsupingiae]|uniref:ABC transporter permease subunit n=1 Tax=Cellulomonas wangsupingiae TaxID=2968085 RepID=A0ABY5KAP3_9CELL|nr:ABC transporter permease subunit [Cellulomonas wangsupingiae]MCC2335360.1 ABC transporter permease subunit [Cellulomonas wangsupingiae]MCM0639020.1 ABC transporter permease subunit [Cellulomonas wangsupingiae]UUI66506.1 ABC transporter permease subunit [Cellulomonas wangsupingiae]